MPICNAKSVVRFALASAVAVSFGIASSGAADAETRTRAKAYKKPAPRVVYDDNSRWYPNNADRLKIGSRIWWDQMQREGRIGGGGGDFRR